MSPEVALVYVENIRKALAEADPANAEVYAANAAAYSDEIRALAAPIRAELAAVPEERRWLVTSEGAFSYLARDFGLDEVYIWPINADQQGTPQQVRKVDRRDPRARGAGVFSESTVPADAARAGRARDRHGLRRRALRRQPVRAGRAGADLPRHAAGDRRDDRQGAGAMTSPSRGSRAEAATEARARGSRDVSVTYRTGLTAVEDASFAIPRGTITALVGVNGSGKSTLFKAIMGFVPLAAGAGRDPRPAGARGAAANLVAYVPQAEEVDWTFPVLVEDVVMMGRYGHMGWLRRPAPTTARWSTRRSRGSAWPPSASGRSASSPAASGSGCSSPARWRRRAG